MNDLEIRRVVYSLLQAGLVDIVRPVGAPIGASGRMFPTRIIRSRSRGQPSDYTHTSLYYFLIITACDANS
jgi:hypothetical protein